MDYSLTIPLYEYDDIPLYEYDDIPKSYSIGSTPNPTNESMKNLSPNRFQKRKRKAKQARQARRKARKAR